MNKFRNNIFLLVAFPVFCWLLLCGSAQEAVKLDGTWYREDGEARQLVSIPEGLKLICPDQTYIYYKIEENTYQMHWTPGNGGRKYRWTLKVKNLNLIENTYENETSPATLVYKYTRVLK
jgi:hypothetical protein